VGCFGVLVAFCGLARFGVLWHFINSRGGAVAGQAEEVGGDP
jgi:hypothetical protein